ncbi:acyl-CoA dehydrogenase family protein [Streptomyces sp. NPDC000594]|uniref:acyl-CoA dehydrogenase family protein n=1 Tax=Streptomyces sp. NPDC000594 TaxID=3154261 RepID=UPI0033213CA4
MDGQDSTDRRALRADTRALLARLWPAEALRSAADRPAPELDRALWRALGEAGFFALRLPPERGGAGLGLPEAVLVFEEAGRVLLPGPLVGTHLAAGAIPAAARGETAVAWYDGPVVAWLAAADGLWPGGDPAGAVPLRSVDPLTPLHRLPPPAGDPVRSFDPVGALLTAAEQLGSASRTAALAARHAREREQFGRPIGSFQAVKHLCAETVVRRELARAAVHAAALTAAPVLALAPGPGPGPDPGPGPGADLVAPDPAAVPDPVAVAAAKLLADEAAERNARDCLQVFGGMGFTWEAEVHLHLKRAWIRGRVRPVAAHAEEICAAPLGTGSALLGTGSAPLGSGAAPLGSG